MLKASILVLCSLFLLVQTGFAQQQNHPEYWDILLEYETNFVFDGHPLSDSEYHEWVEFEGQNFDYYSKLLKKKYLANEDSLLKTRDRNCNNKKINPTRGKCETAYNNTIQENAGEFLEVIKRMSDTGGKRIGQLNDARRKYHSTQTGKPIKIYRRILKNPIIFPRKKG